MIFFVYQLEYHWKGRAKEAGPIVSFYEPVARGDLYRDAAGRDMVVQEVVHQSLTNPILVLREL